MFAALNHQGDWLEKYTVVQFVNLKLKLQVGNIEGPCVSVILNHGVFMN